MIFRSPIYPITDTGLSGLTHKEQVKKLTASGVGIIQIREKELNSAEFFKEASDAIKAASGTSVKILINDRVDIALAVEADGVHLGQEDLSPRNARKLLGDKAIIGYSTHSVRQAIEAATMPVDYIAFGPVFETLTKKNPDAVTGIDQLRTVRREIGKIPLVAIGGIGLSNIRKVAECGADAAALISAVFAGESGIKENIGELKSHWANKNV